MTISMNSLLHCDSWASVEEMEMVIQFHEPLLHVIVGRVSRSSWKWSWPFPWTPRLHMIVGRVLGRWKWSYHFMNPYCTCIVRRVLRRWKWSFPFHEPLSQRDQLGECRGVHGNGHDHFHELLNTRPCDHVGRVSRSSWKWSWPFPWTQHSHNWSVGRVLGRWKWSWPSPWTPYCTSPIVWATCNEEFMEMVMTISMNPTFAQLISWASVGEMEMVMTISISSTLAQLSVVQ